MSRPQRHRLSNKYPKRNSPITHPAVPIKKSSLNPSAMAEEDLEEQEPGINKKGVGHIRSLLHI